MTGKQSDLLGAVAIIIQIVLDHVIVFRALGLLLSFLLGSSSRSSTRVRVVGGIRFTVNGTVERAGENGLAALDFGVASLGSVNGSKIKVEDLAAVVRVALCFAVMLARSNVGHKTKLGLDSKRESKFHHHVAATGDLFMLLAKLLSRLLHCSRLGDDDILILAVIAAVHFNLDATLVEKSIGNTNLDAALGASWKNVDNEIFRTSAREHQEINGGMQLSLVIGKLADEDRQVHLGSNGGNSHLGKRSRQIGSFQIVGFEVLGSVGGFECFLSSCTWVVVVVGG